MVSPRMSRRGVLVQAGIGAAAMAAGAATTRSNTAGPENDTGQVPPLDPPLKYRVVNRTALPGKDGKWYTDGTVRRFPGFTFTSRIPDGPFKQAMTRIRDTMQERSLGALFGYMPPDTYHVTICEGAVDSQRDSESWPEGFDPDAPIADVTQELLDRVRDSGIRAPESFTLEPYEISPVHDVTKGLQVNFRLAPDSYDEVAALQRDLAELCGLPRPDSEKFHAGLTYKLFQNVGAREEEELKMWRLEFLDMVPASLTLQGCEFNVFDNMWGFAVAYDF